MDQPRQERRIILKGPRARAGTAARRAGTPSRMSRRRRPQPASAEGVFPVDPRQHPRPRLFRPAAVGVGGHRRQPIGRPFIDAGAPSGHRLLAPGQPAQPTMDGQEVTLRVAGPRGVFSSQPQLPNDARDRAAGSRRAWHACLTLLLMM